MAKLGTDVFGRLRRLDRDPAQLLPQLPGSSDHLAASGASRERVRSTLFSALRTERSHVGTAHRKVLDFAYLEGPNVSQFLILTYPLRHVRA
jgi:hypothetical protein